MRFLGYALLLGGFLWLACNALIGLPIYNYRSVGNAAAGNRFVGSYSVDVDPGSYIRALWGIYYDQLPRYRMLLLPAGLMLGGGVLLRGKRVPEFRIKGTSERAEYVAVGGYVAPETHSPPNQMRKPGYLLLGAGFIWLMYGALTGLANHQYKSTVRIISSELDKYVPRSAAFGSLRKECDLLKAHYRLLLLPSCFMLLGGLVIGAQKRPIIFVERDGGATEQKVNQRRQYAPRAPEKDKAYRRGLLGLARRAVSGSSFFRDRETDDHGGES